VNFFLAPGKKSKNTPQMAGWAEKLVGWKNPRPPPKQPQREENQKKSPPRGGTKKGEKKKTKPPGWGKNPKFEKPRNKNFLFLTKKNPLLPLREWEKKNRGGLFTN